MKELLKFTPWKNTDTLVSIGSGSGWWEINCVIHQPAGQLILIDKNDHILNQKDVNDTITYFESATLTKNTTSILLKNEEAHKLSLANETADWVLIFNAFHEFEKIEIVLHEVKRVLKKGGRLFLEEEISTNKPLIHEGCGKQLFYKEELISHIITSGFDLIDETKKDEKAIYVLFQKCK